MAQYVCEVCGYVYDEEKKGAPWGEVPESWTCPVCDSPKSYFHITEEQAESSTSKERPAQSPEGTPITVLQATVSERLIDTMVAWGVEVVFGMVGHSNLGLADAIRRQCEEGNLRFIGVRHEGAAAFAASAYGKLTGKPAACLAIAGPGATNLLNC